MMANKRHLFIMDPLSTIEIAKDTSSLLIKEGLTRGHDVYFTDLAGLTLTPQFLRVRCSKVLAVNSDRYQMLEAGDEFAESFDVIWLRKDPPFDETYLAHLSLFDRLNEEKTLFINNPSQVRALNEKLTIFNFPEFIAETIVTMNLEEIRAFWQRRGKIVIKSLTGFSGQDVEMLIDESKDWDKLVKLSNNGTRFIMAQEFLENVYLGDKRIYLLDGQIIGQLLRVPQNSFKGNLHAGGQAASTDLTDREKEIANEVGKFLQTAGVLFAGIDLIDGRLTEINVTSPGVVVEANRVSGTTLEKDIWDCVESRLRGRQ